jgi:Rad3-related DNA helicase
MMVKDQAYIDENFVLVHEPASFQFKRVYGAHTFNHLLRPMADRFLFMSSTILNKDGFCHDLGIEPNEAAFISLKSEFQVNNRPVYYLPSAKMNAKWNTPENDIGRTQMLTALTSILDMHKTETGIVHTGNFQIAQWLVKNLDKKISHKIFHHNPNLQEDRNAVIQSFIEETKPCILISPSSTEGLDLKEELGRFAIFVKVPFLSLADHWVKRRMELSTEWYQRQALVSIIQGGGRVVRSKDDWGKVYILDACWGMLYKNTFNQIPSWWRDAYTVI